MGQPTYKGMVTWTEEFEGVESQNVRATTDTNLVRLFHGLLVYVGTGMLIDLEIKQVNTD